MKKIKEKFKPKIKEIWAKDTKIKIKTLLEVTEKPKGCYSYKEKLINIEIDNGYFKTSSSFPVNKNGTKELFEFIKGELDLK